MNILGKIKAYIEITRPINIMLTIAVVIGAAIISDTGEFDWEDVFYASLAAAFAVAAGNIINDLFDIGIDIINCPSRPLPSKRIKPIEAKIFYLILIHASFISSGNVNVAVFIIVLIATNLLFLYSYKFKRIPLLGNFIIASLTGLVFIYGGAAVNNLNAAVIPALFAFLINFIREIVKDMEDVRGDEAAGIKTFPAKYGFKSSKRVVLFLSFILIFSTIIPFFYELYQIEYFILVMVIVNPAIIYMIKSLYENDSVQNLHKMSWLLKINMVIGLAAIVLGR
jgi:geranylgeranylglycerol-phosphate geranylgeranyltransferase